MGEVKGRRDINNELGNLHSEKVEIRVNGLNRLILIIRDKRQDLKEVNDTGYHTILESVFRVAKIESSNYTRATKYTKPKIESRLSACAALIRVVVEVGVQKLRHKTVKALVEHIIQTLPTADAGYCEPLCRDYLKALVCLLEFTAHPEHFLRDEWVELIDFCLEIVRDLNRTTDAYGSNLSNGSGILHKQRSNRNDFSRSASPSTGVDRGRTSMLSASQPAMFPLLRDCQLDVALCLQHLVSVPNAPISENAHDIVEVIVSSLNSYTKVASMQNALLGSINSMMFRIVADDTKLAIDTLKKMLSLFRRLWDIKDNSIKESLLILLSYGEVLLPRLIAKCSTAIRADLDALVEILRADYCTRRQREKLQLDDLSLIDPSEYMNSQGPLRTGSIQLRCGNVKAEQPWSLLATSASILTAIEKGVIAHVKHDETDNLDHPRKRPKLTRPLDDIFRFAQGSNLSEKLFALQLLVFVFERLDFEETCLQDHLNMLVPCLSDDDGHLLSWAMLAIASATGQMSARSTSLKSFWLKIWQLTARHVTYSSTCRAACHLMSASLRSGLVQIADVADIADNMTRSVDLNGPTECSDSALTLWTLILLSKERENLKAAPEASGNVLHWLFSRWSPARVRDRQHAMNIVQRSSTPGTLRLICVCLGLPPDTSSPRSGLSLGTLSQARLKVLRERKLQAYMFLNEFESPKPRKVRSIWETESAAPKPPHPRLRTLSSRLIDFLIDESLALLHVLEAPNTDISASISTDSIYLATSFLIVGYAFLKGSVFPKTDQESRLRELFDQIKVSIISCLRSHSSRREFAEGFLGAFDSVLESIEQIVSGQDLLTKGAACMASSIDLDIWREALHPHGAPEDSLEQDAMDLENDFDSQRTHYRNEATTIENSHQEVAASTCEDALRICTVSKVYMMSVVENSEDRRASAPHALSSLVEYWVSLSAPDFLLCRNVLLELLDSGITISENDAISLLQYLAGILLRQYEYERSEVTLGVVLDVMIRLLRFWIYDESTEAGEIGHALYTWFIGTALNKDISSPHVHICLTALLQKVIKARPDYCKSEFYSARTNLFHVLDKGNMVVKFHIAKNLPDLFGLFVLKEHEAILADVLDHLPKDRNWIEGIALRLYVLAVLATSWSTLLRHCIYRILECPNGAPNSAKYAETCLAHVAISLDLADKRELFKIFSPQILFTWLDSDFPLAALPYAIFGYPRLLDLLEDVQDEVLGLLFLRGRHDETMQLAEDLKVPYETLLEACFSKVSAYCLARDTAWPSDREEYPPQAESRIRKTLGKERYASLMKNHFAKIFAISFRAFVSPESGIEKGFQKHSAASQYSCYQEMINISGPDKVLPKSQQPWFGARYLFDQIEFICRRTSYEVQSLWKPQLYIYVFREIMNSIHPALGPLHACSALRKIRLLVSLAGKTALEHYPLEMALHSLKPYLTNTQCADEVIGIAQYLLNHGAVYLQRVPAFLAGYAVSTLTSMKEFFDSTQDSTTQESQFQATMSRAQTFHRWFSSFLEDFSSPQLDEKSANCFKAIVSAASHIQAGGNARTGSYASELLLECLEDERSGRNLLDDSCRTTILKFLCTSFEVPLSFRDDILGSDEDALRYAPVIWKSCQRGVSKNYIQWAGRVLGRAYAYKGLVDGEMVREALYDTSPHSLSAHMATLSSSSRLSILKLLSDLLRSDCSTEVGKAEATLSAIVTDTVDTEDFLEIEQSLSSSIRSSLLWKDYRSPIFILTTESGLKLKSFAMCEAYATAQQWIQSVSVALAKSADDDPILSKIANIIHIVGELAEKTFPYIVHLVLLREISSNQPTRNVMSELIRKTFQQCKKTDREVVHSARILLQAILYLRTQPLPNEMAKADRDKWLDFDYRSAAAAAIQCSMFKVALLFIEIDYSEASKASRRSSAIKIQEPTDLLLAIYENIDEQDAFYGVQQPSSLYSMMTRLEYENAGFKSLSFRGAHYDGQIRLSSGEHQMEEESLARALDSLELNGLSRSLLSRTVSTGAVATDSVLRTARKLEQWEISAPASHCSSASTIYRMFQGINNAADASMVATSLNSGFSDAMSQLRLGGAKSSVQSILGSLAVLTEADEVFASRKLDQLKEVLRRFEGREHWMLSESFEHTKGIISCRETALSLLSKSLKLQDMLKTTQHDARSLESCILLSSSRMSRLHGALQNALSTVTYLTELTTPSDLLGKDISAAVQLESAHVLWGQGEMTASIRMLQELKGGLSSTNDKAHVGKSELLATLGHHTSEARLEKPDEIINRYLLPALEHLCGSSEGNEAGKVFHEFASFCDQQLQNADGLEDYQRVQKLRERKEAEVGDLDRMIKSAGSQTRERDNLKSFRDKAKKWFELDDREYQRLRESRQTFLRQSLENYLLCLKACDGYDNDALRFSALWLENYDNDIANAAVAKHVGQVASRKFAALMNQWSSRLLEAPGHFQALLASLVLRICVEHPYHGMYQIFAGSKSKGGKDSTALARHAAANNIVQQLKDNKRSSRTWLAVHNANIGFVRFATERLQAPYDKPGSKVPFNKSSTGAKMAQDVPTQRIPPPTAKIELRADCNYSNVPSIVKFQSEFSVASGISMPKIATAIGTDGVKYKLLFKGGNDDLRQDSIMEQVFEQVSNLLQTQRVTRQRNLGIRTYKVLPLTANAGIMEFVTDTIPLHEYLLPAHQRHFPKDAKPSQCRKHIADAQSKSASQRVKVYLQVCDQFHPVLRYFFMERFENPDDWFEKRLAYTRSTAAISILGHILGLGDRHGHNILLDEKTGEVVHIDLGIAFEQGRILPVPEVVPFRLTRDLVDGMGITKTEGVFRRCCEFTLEALRNESYSIMTILDVLRYDPLYSWSLSPLRLKKMQDAQTENPKLPGAAGYGADKGEGEPGEADRALTVVKKKLSKSLSVQATVNELIQMATDERNLAVLYCGWAAYV